MPPLNSHHSLNVVVSIHHFFERKTGGKLKIKACYDLNGFGVFLLLMGVICAIGDWSFVTLGFSSYEDSELASLVLMNRMSGVWLPCCYIGVAVILISKYRKKKTQDGADS